MSRHIYIHKTGGQAPVGYAPTVAIVSITNITSNGATVLARIVDDGGSTVVNYQFWAEAPGQNLVQATVYPNGDGTFNHTFTTLASNIQYKITAYAYNTTGASSANQYFTTASSVVVPTLAITSVAKTDTNAPEINSNLQSLGGGTVTVSGVCYSSTNTSPTTADSKTTNGPLTVSAFVSVITGLAPNTRYYFRAYATNQAGTGYSNGWNFTTASNKILILQFVTNCPPTKAFSPSIVPISGTYEWDLGNGTIAQGNAVNHSYANSNQKTVKLYCNSGTPAISDILIYNQYVVGMMDISHSAFASLVRVNIYQNPSLTGIALPSLITGAVEVFNISNNGITGEINLAALVNFSSSGTINISYNPITFVYFDNTVSGLINYIEMRNCNLSAASFTWLHRFTNNASIILASNPNLDSVHFGTVGHIGTLGGLDVRNCSFTDMVIGGFTGSLTATNLVWIFQDNSMSAGEVNTLLWELNSNAVNGSSGQIFIAGNNAAPDATSYNKNGVAYKASLIGKGFQVTTN